jgi:hypothetical protein
MLRETRVRVQVQHRITVIVSGFDLMHYKRLRECALMGLTLIFHHVALSHFSLCMYVWMCHKLNCSGCKLMWAIENLLKNKI